MAKIVLYGIDPCLMHNLKVSIGKPGPLKVTVYLSVSWHSTLRKLHYVVGYQGRCHLV